MVRLARRFLSLVCWGACVMVTAFVVLFAPAFALPETAAVSTSPAVNVKYIHGAIKNLWGVDIPYSPELKSDQYVVNMRYLLGYGGHRKCAPGGDYNIIRHRRICHRGRGIKKHRRQSNQDIDSETN